MRRLATALIVAACAAGLVVAVPSAGAAAPPKVSLHPERSEISALGRSAYDYHATNLRKGTRLALQSHDETWTTIARTAPTHGTADGTFHVDGPGEPGTFTLRVIATRHGRTVATSGRHVVHAYGRVTLSALCQGVLHKSMTAHGNTCGKGSADYGKGRTFHYVMLTGESTPAEGYREQFGAGSTSCRSISLRFVPDTAGPETIELHQNGALPTKHTSSGKGVGTFSATLTGKRFGVSVASDDNDLFTSFNGSASCYTADGRP